MKQSSFLDGSDLVVPANRTPTSRAAAEAIKPRACTMETQVWAMVSNQGQRGATREEIAAALEMKIQTVCARCDALIRKGAIRDSGRTRSTESGRQAAVLVAANERASQ